MKKLTFRAISLISLIAILVSIPKVTPAYSVLTHEAIIDQAWKDSIQPILLARYPHATAEQLRDAHAYAYGGAIMPDVGYYPLGSKFFSDAVHYVRSGDFVEILLGEAQDLNEYAFALGCLAHYVADNLGHPIAVNRSVSALYPKLRARYGESVTYAEDPTAHLRTEFGFDVVQLARGRYAPESYHDFIGFKVSKTVVERAFQKTYGLDVDDVFVDFDLAIATFRRAVSTVIPEMTKVAWETKKDQIEKASPGITRDKFVYQLSREEYEREWGKEYKKPNAFDKTLALFFRVVPKVGPFRAISFKVPTPEAERMFEASFDQTLSRYRSLLGQAQARSLNLQNTDFDTGEPTRAGEYKLADEAFASLLKRLADNKFKDVTQELRQNIIGFYGDLSAPIATKKDKDDWKSTVRALEQLKGSQVNAVQTSRRR
ncbi:MAG TPA: zinc dependent phospholipase C family protein [Blastocatellia bacterium]|nr:zinc dependent phospholipase C family protein [Blastocatellia bacterium]